MPSTLPEHYKGTFVSAGIGAAGISPPSRGVLRDLEAFNFEESDTQVLLVRLRLYLGQEEPHIHFSPAKRYGLPRVLHRIGRKANDSIPANLILRLRPRARKVV